MLSPEPKAATEHWRPARAVRLATASPTIFLTTGDNPRDEFRRTEGLDEDRRGQLLCLGDAAGEAIYVLVSPLAEPGKKCATPC